MSKVGIKGFPVYQNDQDFIIGKASISELRQYTRYTERLIIDFDENDLPVYNQRVQRKVEKNRVEKIADFLINDETATFPTNIILNIPQSIIAEQYTDKGIVNIIFEEKVIDEIKKADVNGSTKDSDIFVSIIDGQHRVRGIEVAIERLKGYIQDNKDGRKNVWKDKLNNLLNMELVVSCFIDKTLEYQAMIFSTINRTQKRVSQDLVTSLFGLSTSDTPYKTALEVVLALNGHIKSPFYKRIKLYGGEYTQHASTPISQATMVKSIVALISESVRESENDIYRKRKELNKPTKKELPFRSFYANDEDKKIADCMFYFFNSVRKYFPEDWKYDGIKKPENILQSTVGYDALMHIMKDILVKSKMKSFNSDSFDLYLEKIKNIDVRDTTTFPMSTNGKKIFYDAIFIRIFPDDDTVKAKKEELQTLCPNYKAI